MNLYSISDHVSKRRTINKSITRETVFCVFILSLLCVSDSLQVYKNSRHNFHVLLPLLPPGKKKHWFTNLFATYKCYWPFCSYSSFGTFHLLKVLCRKSFWIGTTLSVRVQSSVVAKFVLGDIDPVNTSKTSFIQQTFGEE